MISWGKDVEKVKPFFKNNKLITMRRILKVLNK